MPKDLCVFLDGSERDEGLLDKARQMAVLFDAHVSGLFLNRLPDMPMTDMYGYTGMDLGTMLDDARAKGDEKAAELEQRMAALGVPYELRRYDTDSTNWSDVLLAEARLADLLVAPLEKDLSSDLATMVETVLFGSGRAVLLVPETAKAEFDPKTVILGWRNTQEAARALAESMAFLKRADRVSVCMIEESGKGSVDRATLGNDIARHLSRHNVSVVLNPLPMGNGVGETLVEEARLADADLIVMGAYGHSRFREWVMGGATRTVLTSANVPVLLAH